MPSTFVGDVSAVNPTTSDWAFIVDASDGNDGKLATLSKLLGTQSDNFAEIRSDFTGGGVSSTHTYVYGTAAIAEFASNNTMSKAVAGDPDAGTVLTADAANNKLIIPAYTRVLVQWQKLFVPDFTPTTTVPPQAVLGLCNVDGTPNTDTGAGYQGSAHVTAVTSVSTPPAACTVTWINDAMTLASTAIVENTTASAVDLELYFTKAIDEGFGYTMADAVTWVGFLRAIWMGDLTP